MEEKGRDEIETERRGSREEESNAEEKKNGVERDRKKKSRIFSLYLKSLTLKKTRGDRRSERERNKKEGRKGERKREQEEKRMFSPFVENHRGRRSFRENEERKMGEREK